MIIVPKFMENIKVPKFSPAAGCGCCSGFPAWTVRHANVSDKLHFYRVDMGVSCPLHYFYDSESGNEVTYSNCNLRQDSCSSFSFSGISYIIFEKTNISLTGCFPQTWIKANKIKKIVISGLYPLFSASLLNLEFSYSPNLPTFVYGSHFQGISEISGALSVTNGSFQLPVQYNETFYPPIPFINITPMIGGRNCSLSGTNIGTQLVYGTGFTLDVTGFGGFSYSYYADSGKLNSPFDRHIVSFRSYTYPLDSQFTDCNHGTITGANPNSFCTSAFADRPESIVSSPLVNDLGPAYPTFLSGLTYSTYSDGDGPILSAIEQTTNLPFSGVGSHGSGTSYRSCRYLGAAGGAEPFSGHLMLGAFKKILENPILSAYGIRYSGSGGPIEYNLMAMSNTGTRHILEEWNLADYYSVSGVSFTGYLQDHNYNPSLVLTSINQYIAPSSDLCL